MYARTNSRIANPHAQNAQFLHAKSLQDHCDTSEKSSDFFPPFVPDALGDSNNFLSSVSPILFLIQPNFYLSRLGTSKYFAYIVVGRKAIARHDRLKKNEK